MGDSLLFQSLAPWEQVVIHEPVDKGLYGLWIFGQVLFNPFTLTIEVVNESLNTFLQGDFTVEGLANADNRGNAIPLERTQNGL